MIMFLSDHDADDEKVDVDNDDNSDENYDIR